MRLDDVSLRDCSDVRQQPLIIMQLQSEDNFKARNTLRDEMTLNDFFKPVISGTHRAAFMNVNAPKKYISQLRSYNKRFEAMNLVIDAFANPFNELVHITVLASTVNHPRYIKFLIRCPSMGTGEGEGCPFEWSFHYHKENEGFFFAETWSTVSCHIHDPLLEKIEQPSWMNPPIILELFEYDKETQELSNEPTHFDVARRCFDVGPLVHRFIDKTQKKYYFSLDSPSRQDMRKIEVVRKWFEKNIYVYFENHNFTPMFQEITKCKSYKVYCGCFKEARCHFKVEFYWDSHLQKFFLRDGGTVCLGHYNHEMDGTTKLVMEGKWTVYSHFTRRYVFKYPEVWMPILRDRLTTLKVIKEGDCRLLDLTQNKTQGIACQGRQQYARIMVQVPDADDKVSLNLKLHHALLMVQRFGTFVKALLASGAWKKVCPDGTKDDWGLVFKTKARLDACTKRTADETQAIEDYQTLSKLRFEFDCGGVKENPLFDVNLTLPETKMFRPSSVHVMHLCAQPTCANLEHITVGVNTINTLQAHMGHYHALYCKGCHLELRNGNTEMSSICTALIASMCGDCKEPGNGDSMKELDAGKVESDDNSFIAWI